MINFYPGPSKIYPGLEKHISTAFSSGILSQNHRSQAFMNLLEETITRFKNQMDIPQDYKVYFISSATEGWEIAAQSLLHGNVQFIYNGAFGKKWFKYVVTNPASLIRPTLPLTLQKSSLRGSRFLTEESFEKIDFEENINCFCAVQNETSNGTQIPIDKLLSISSDSLKCFDITSSLGGVKIDFNAGDYWLASVQKCLGLPSGMGVLIVSPKAMAMAEQIGDRNYYNSLLNIEDNFKKYQTHYTPSILHIYLLNELLKMVPHISETDQLIKERANTWYDFFENSQVLSPLVKKYELRSDTVIAVEGSPEKVKQIKQLAQENGITLGNGYGEWKENTFRIANFPAIDNTEIKTLQKILTSLL